MKNYLITFNGFLEKMRRDHCDAYAAQGAFFIILSFIPFLMVFLSLIRYTPIPREMIETVLKEMLPDYIQPLILSTVQEVYTKSAGILPLTIVTAVWSSSKGLHCITNGLNTVNEITETRNWLLLRFRAILHTILFLITIISSMMLLVFGQTIKDFLESTLQGIPGATKILFESRNIIAIFLLIFLFVIMFKILPNKKLSILSQIPGATIAAISWLVFSYVLSFYVNEFHGLSMYGSLTTVILVMLWLYICMHLMLVSAEINVYFQDRIYPIENRIRFYKHRLIRFLLRKLRKSS